MNKIYDIEKSPLYKLSNKRKLEKLLKIEKYYFDKKHNYEYSSFQKPKKGGGKRTITNPIGELKELQKYIFKYLNRIKRLEWLVSGAKGKSSVDNAKVHKENFFVATLDIKKFYDSTKSKYVYKFLKNKLKVSDDIACLLLELLTDGGKIPTGTPCSQLLAYFAYEDIFNEINNECAKRNMKFTLYVDDMTISSKESINKRIINIVETILIKSDLSIKRCKTVLYGKIRNKTITGVIQNKKNELKLENSKRQEILKLYIELTKKVDMEKMLKLKGLLNYARQIENNIFPTIYEFIEKYKNEIKEFNRKKRKYYKKKRFIKRAS